MSEPTHIAVIDAGHGETYGIIYDIAKGKRTPISFPTVRASTSGETLGLGKQHELTYKWAEWQGAKYYFGFDTLISRGTIEQHAGRNRYGNEFQASMIAKALADAGLKDADVELVVFCPPGMYRDPEIKDRIEREFAAGNCLSISLKGDAKPRQFRITGLTLRIEGLMAGFALISDAKGNLVENNLADSLLIADLGMQTADFAEVIGGKYNPTDLDVATFDQEGIGDKLFKPLWRDLKKHNSALSDLTYTDLDLSIRKFNQNGGGLVINYAGLQNDDTLTDFATKRYLFWRTKYAESIANNIIDSEFRALSPYRYAFFVGGGYHLAKDIFYTLYGDKILDTSKLAHVKNIKPYEWNAEAGMRAGLARARKNGWIE